jgi:serine/threonine protein kinase
MTEFAGNRSLADHLPGATNADLCLLYRETRIVKIVVGIVLAMRFLHSKGVVHRHFNPKNILFDWDWNVRIAGLGDCILIGDPDKATLCERKVDDVWPLIDFHYLTPECYDDKVVPESDIFAFGLILYELVTGHPAFGKHMAAESIGRKVVVENFRPSIPESVAPAVADLIRRYWATECRRRPPFHRILGRLAALRFKLSAGVNSAKVVAFVTEIEAQEKEK